MRVIVGVTGASGVVIGVRLVEELLKGGHEVHAVVTSAGWGVIRHELGPGLRLPGAATVHGEHDFSSVLNSGSFLADAMAVAPCSMKSLAAIANGFADNVLVRAADCMLRGRRRLVLVPRETPLSLSAIENMASACRAGAVILPPCAAYYPKPASVEDMTGYFVGKVLDVLGVENRLYRRWEEVKSRAADARRGRPDRVGRVARPAKDGP